MTELLDAQGQAHAALSSAVADLGQRVLSDPQLLRSVMSDRLPDLPRERNLLVMAAEAGVAGELTQHVYVRNLHLDAAIAQVSRLLTERMSIEPTASMWVTGEYAQALGYRPWSGMAFHEPVTRIPTQISLPPQSALPDHARYEPNLPTPLSSAPTVAPGYPGYAPPEAGDALAGGASSAPTVAPGYPGYAPPEAGDALAGGAWSEPPAPPPRRRKRWPIFALVGVAVLGLTAGLLVWAPWHKVPVAPKTVHGQSPNATAVLVSWVPYHGGATVDHYLILRDGSQVGSVPASQTSYLDNGLAPGTTHRYRIIAQSGTQRSQPSVTVVVRTITPSPVGLAAGQTTWTTVLFRWSPPPNSPVPSSYAIFSGGAAVATVPGGVNSYSVTGLQLSTTYTYQVAAIWGGQQSGRSSVLSVTTLAPPLQGSITMRYKTLSTPGSGASLTVGQTWSDSWTITPNCTGNRCILATDGQFGPPGFTTHSFTMTLRSSGAAYTGSTKAAISMCGSVNAEDTVSVSIAASGAVDNGAWTSWTGTMVLSSPYLTSGNQYCSPQSWTFSLTGTSP